MSVGKHPLPRLLTTSEAMCVRAGAVLRGWGCFFMLLFGALATNRAEAQEPPKAFVPDPAEACQGKEPGASCWMELADRPGCYAWNPNLAAGETVTWSGDCSGGLAQGTDSLQWTHPDDEGNPLVSGGEGELRDGKPHGAWSHYFDNGGLSEGSYAAGKKHGEWMEVFPDGTVFRGEYAEGLRRGRWESIKGGDAGGGFYVAGKRHGQWKVFGVASDDETVGLVREGLYVAGKPHGRWVIRFDDGTVREFTYRSGVLHGDSSSRFASGAMEEGPYVDGKKHGDWTYARPNGNRLRSGEYVDGEREGAWREYDEGGDLLEYGEYKKGEKHGDWTRRIRGSNAQFYGEDVRRWADGSLELLVPDRVCGPMADDSDLPCWYPVGPDGFQRACFVLLEPDASGFPSVGDYDVLWQGETVNKAKQTV